MSAFENYFKLPFDGVDVHISSFEGTDVTRGYNRVVADTEGLWFELTENQMYWTNFKTMQKTKTRQYWEQRGLHQRLVTELNPHPRKHMPAVGLKRNVPSCSLGEGIFYLDVYQAKVINPSIGTLCLGTIRLVKQLQPVFGTNYYPKQGTTKASVYRSQLQDIKRSPRIILSLLNA